MKPLPSSEHEEQDRELLRILKDLGSLPAAYPPELLTARRSAFLTQVERFQAVEAGEGLSAGDEPIVKLLGSLKSAQAEYPADLLAARRSALLKQMDRAEAPTLLDAFRSFIHRTFQTPGTLPRLRQLSFVIGSLLAALFIGSLLFNRGESSLTPAPTPGVAAPGASEVAISICEAEDRIPPCAPEALAPEQDLANSGNGSARPAISSANAGAAHTAAYVNDGRGGASWVSHGADSWIKIDLGKVTTINTVSLQSGDLDSSGENDPGQFVIAVALSDVYADGDSRNDSTEYAQVFHSEQTGFGGTLSEAETIQTQFPSVRARYVKITFEKAGAAIEEVGIFMVEPPVVAKQPTRPPHEDPPGVPLNPARTDTPSPIDTAGPLPTGTGLATDTVVSTPTETPNPSETPPPESSATPTALPTETVTPVPTEPPPSDTPVPSATAAPPTVPPPTALPPEVEPTAANTEPIVVTGNRQTLTFTCNGNAAEIRGHANTITLLGSCSSITVTGNGNSVFWESGSPVLQDKGKDNLIRQL